MKTVAGVTLGALLFPVAVLATSVLATSAVAEVIRVPVGQQAAEKHVLELPPRGTAKAEVERRFGPPLTQQPAVGTPPISSWDYENYRIYFERDLVLHAVLKGTATPRQAD